MRSPTAAEVAHARWGWRPISPVSRRAPTKELAHEQIDRAERIFVMERRQRKRLTTLFGTALAGRWPGVLDIPDRFCTADPTLVALLESRLPRHFGPPRSSRSAYAPKAPPPRCWR